MWIFSMLLILVRKIEKGYLQRAGKKLGIIGLVLLGILAWGAAQILNTPVIAVYRFGIYGFAFFAGYFIFAAEEVTDTLKKYALWLVGAACILGILYAWHDYGNNYAVEPSVNSCWIFFKKRFEFCTIDAFFLQQKQLPDTKMQSLPSN